MEINYDSAAALRTLLEESGLGMRKKFGQNFLINPGIRKKLVDALEIGEGDEVWEVGPGLGAMTRELLDRGARVRAFEIDPGFIDLLKEIFTGREGFTLVEGDVLKTWRKAPPAPYLLGNLPYNIGSVLLANFIEEGRFFKRMIVTVQKEVARRMAAKPGSADYSSFSVLIGSAYTVSPLMVIGGRSFYPAPRVDSQGIRLDYTPCAAINSPCAASRLPLFYSLLRQLFSSRRKTVKNNLQSFISARGGGSRNPDMAVSILEECGIKPAERAENLTIEQFAELAEKLGKYDGLC
ncbi:ribosomal RNA small subunit methyltransferase A [Spirochaetia bacterium]|nr:ribosomal RNA small subunit methyltransferase A [Spirochaetia bacterium]